MDQTHVRTLIALLETGDATAQALAAVDPEKLIPILIETPALREYVLERIGEMTGDLEALRNEIRGVPPDTTLTADLEKRIEDWFRNHPGKHKSATVRADLQVSEGSKPFKTALNNLITRKVVRFSDKRGQGAEYWLAG